MAAQEFNRETYTTPVIEYRSELLMKRLKYSLANFAQIRFKKSMQNRLSAACAKF